MARGGFKFTCRVAFYRPQAPDEMVVAASLDFRAVSRARETSCCFTYLPNPNRWDGAWRLLWLRHVVLCSWHCAGGSISPAWNGRVFRVHHQELAPALG